MRSTAYLFALIVFHFLPAMVSVQTTVAEVNGSSSWSTFGVFGNAGAVDASSGDIAIDVSQNVDVASNDPITDSNVAYTRCIFMPARISRRTGSRCSQSGN